MIDFDGPNKIITLASGVTDVDAIEIYSRWKDWVKDDNAQYLRAFDNSEGGSPIDATTLTGSYFFLRNDLGWRVKPPEEDIQITINGNFFPRDFLLPYLNPTDGNFNTAIRISSSSLTQVVTVSSGSGLSPEQAQQLLELYQLSGLQAGNPMTVTPTGRNVADISQSFTGDGENSTTVTRQ